MRRQYPDAPIAGVGAVVLDQDRVLLVRRGQEPLKGHWSLPGGALELGERLEEGVAREVEEETGLRIEPLEIVEVFDHIVREEGSRRVRFHYVLVDFRCRIADASIWEKDAVEMRLKCGDDAVEARWANREEIQGGREFKLAPFTVQVIEKAFRQAERERLGAKVEME